MENKIMSAVKVPLKDAGIEVLEVYVGEESNQKTLYIIIDSEKGVDIDLCVSATKIINPIIDSLDIDLTEYILDVGSKGVKE